MDVYGHLLPSVDEALARGLDDTLRAARGSRAASLRPDVVHFKLASALTSGFVEAGSGIEPLCEVLQTSA